MQIILNEKEYEELLNYKYELIRLKEDVEGCFCFKRKIEYDKEIFINYSALDIENVDINICKIAELVGLSEEEIKFLEEYLKID